MLSHATKIHFIGIGGIGMSGLALLLLEQGYIISGSDECPNHITEKIISRKGCVFSGHSGSNINGAELVVYSSAVGPDNPEMIAAKNKKIPLVH